MQGTLCGLCSGCLHMFWLSACLCGLCTSCPHLCVCVCVCLCVGVRALGPVVQPCERLESKVRIALSP